MDNDRLWVLPKDSLAMENIPLSSAAGEDSATLGWGSPEQAVVVFLNLDYLTDCNSKSHLMNSINSSLR